VVGDQGLEASEDGFVIANSGEDFAAEFDV
jgi:hypothetical protein